MLNRRRLSFEKQVQYHEDKVTNQSSHHISMSTVLKKVEENVTGPLTESKPTGWLESASDSTF